MKIQNKFEEILEYKVVKDVKEESIKLNIPVFLVGGAVRDLILGEKSHDFDFVTIGDPFNLVKNLSKKWNKNFKSFPFKTYEFEFDNYEIDFAMARREKYPQPASLPQVEPVKNIEEDLKRRDFTINAIALELYPEMKIIDIFDGIKDIKEKRIKVLKKESFKEDPTRAIRAIKYNHKLGFEICINETEFKLAKEFIKFVSFPRIKKELREISILRKRKEILLHLIDINIFESYFGKIIENKTCIKEILEIFDKKFPKYKKEEWIYLFAILLKNKDVINKIENFLEKNEKREFLLCFKNQKNKLNYEMSEESFLISLLKSGIPYYKINFLLKNFQNINDIFINGDYLLKMGFKGKIIGEIIKKIKTEKLKGKIKDKFGEIKLIENFYINKNEDTVF